jgi:ABC-type multidrug transport system ATPase subunit
MNALQTYNLSKQFAHLQALDNINLAVPKGSIFGFLGPNGSGKSTLIKILTGLIAPTNGTFSVFEKQSSEGYKVRENMSALVDRADFYKNLSAYDNLMLMARLSNHDSAQNIDEILNLVGLYQRRHDKVKTFSQGMKQRLGIGQALLPDPKLLILDEPTTGLDPLGMVEVRDFILKIAKERNVTIFLSSHLLHEVEEICSHVGLIFNGKMENQGSIETIFSSIDQVTIDLEIDKKPETVKILSTLEGIESIQELPNLLKIKIKYAEIPTLIQKLVKDDIKIFGISQRNRLETFFLNRSRDQS